VAKAREEIVLENEVEAALMETILQEQGIPHFIMSYRDGVYGGIWQIQKGWGQILAPDEYRNGILAILRLVRSNRTLPPLV